MSRVKDAVEPAQHRAERSAEDNLEFMVAPHTGVMPPVLIHCPSADSLVPTGQSAERVEDLDEANVLGVVSGAAVNTNGRGLMPSWSALVML